MDFGLNSEQLELIQKLIEDAVKPLREQVEKLENDLETVENELDEKASDSHNHNEYAYQGHIERSEDSFNAQLRRLENNLDNLEYLINDVERKAEHAQSTADDAKRSTRGGW